MSRRRGRAYVLTGATASGKTTVAHRLARLHDLPILSADSMLVYRGMDIGTAKPTRKERAEVRYYGIDLTTPDRTFSVGDYLRYVHTQVPDEDLIVVGGTGLYIKCLLQGLQPSPAPDPALRGRAEETLERGGLPALQQMALQEAPEAYRKLADPQNPRRIIRAMERAAAGHPIPAPTASGNAQPMIVGLHWERDALILRITQRIARMIASGWLAEACQLFEAYPELSSTASQAIGYAELFAVANASSPLPEAISQIGTRTRRLAKRQTTWFRHQLNIHWLTCSEQLPINCLVHNTWQAWKSLPPTHMLTAPMADQTPNP